MGNITRMSNGQKMGWNQVGLLILANQSVADIEGRLSKLPETAPYRQGGHKVIDAYRENPANFCQTFQPVEVL